MVAAAGPVGPGFGGPEDGAVRGIRDDAARRRRFHPRGGDLRVGEVFRVGVGLAVGDDLAKDRGNGGEVIGLRVADLHVGSMPR